MSDEEKLRAMLSWPTLPEGHSDALSDGEFVELIAQNITPQLLVQSLLTMSKQQSALLKAAKEALPWVENLFKSVDLEWGGLPECTWAKERAEAQQVLEDLRAAVAGAEGKQ